MKSRISAIPALFLATAAHAHDAPSGWAYPLACCYPGDDCAQIADATVTALPQGYWVEIQPGDHPKVIDAPFMAFVPYGSSTIRDAPDGLFHACILGGRVQCLFVPGMGS